MGKGCSAREISNWLWTKPLGAGEMLIQEHKSSPGQRWPKGAALCWPRDEGKFFILFINDALSSPNSCGLIPDRFWRGWEWGSQCILFNPTPHHPDCWYLQDYSTSLWFTISNQKPFPKSKRCPFGTVVLFKGQEVLHTTDIWHLEKLGVFRRSWGEGEAHHFWGR